jgi:hypothetical protein
LHPHFDAVVEGILSRDKDALIVFAQTKTLTHQVESDQQHEYGLDIYSEAKRRLLYDARLDHVNQRRLPSAWQERIWRRWHKSRRIRFLTDLPRAHYVGLVRAAAAVLDTFPVSPAGATLEALAMGTPVVTMAPGSSQVPSMSTTHGMYRMMGLHKVTVQYSKVQPVRYLMLSVGCICILRDSTHVYFMYLERCCSLTCSLSQCSVNGIESYVRVALRLATETVWAKRVRAVLAQRKHRLFDDTGAVSDWSNFLLRIGRPAAWRRKYPKAFEDAEAREMERVMVGKQDWAREGYSKGFNEAGATQKGQVGYRV